MDCSGCNRELHLVDTASPYTTRVLTAPAAAPLFLPGDGGGGKPLSGLGKLVASRNGLLLFRTGEAGTPDEALCVFSAATGRTRTLPPGLIFDGGQYAILAGDGEAGGAPDGQPFQVLKASMEVSGRDSRLQTQTFSSKHGDWGPYTETPAPGVTGSRLRHLSRPLAAADAVHWLCVTDTGSHVVKLQLHLPAGGAGQQQQAAAVTSTRLPASFHARCPPHRRFEHVTLATAWVGANPAVVMVDTGRVWMWVRPERATTRWRERAQVVVEKEAIMAFTGEMGEPVLDYGYGQVEWFGERSGVLLLRFPLLGYLWLHLPSREILRWSDVHYPYEDLSSWLPTFSPLLLIHPSINFVRYID
ncbi:hypothetical protein ACP4OV_003500 [Aristida adscensionis]